MDIAGAFGPREYLAKLIASMISAAKRSMSMGWILSRQIKKKVYTAALFCKRERLSLDFGIIFYFKHNHHSIFFNWPAMCVGSCLPAWIWARLTLGGNQSNDACHRI